MLLNCCSGRQLVLPSVLLSDFLPSTGTQSAIADATMGKKPSAKGHYLWILDVNNDHTTFQNNLTIFTRFNNQPINVGRFLAVLRFK
ncbi:MAG: hypothetical protein LBF88_09730 [Planctomycetaceae bacterium]|jgi:hypothetical protein|nr:hypothetical protein [Planctomycetaceae bacterium]